MIADHVTVMTWSTRLETFLFALIAKYVKTIRWILETYKKIDLQYLTSFGFPTSAHRSCTVYCVLCTERTWHTSLCQYVIRLWNAIILNNNSIVKFDLQTTLHTLTVLVFFSTIGIGSRCKLFRPVEAQAHVLHCHLAINYLITPNVTYYLWYCQLDL